MVLATENNSPPSSSKKPQLLKPYLTSSSIDGYEAPQHHSAPSPLVSFNGWRFANPSFRHWANKMAIFHEPIWRKAGIFEAIMASTYRIHKNTDLVLAIAEKWCQETKTFVLPWGEATMTLEDVMMLVGFSVLGSPVFGTLDSSGEKIMAKLAKEWLNIQKDKVRYVTQVVWMERFADKDDELEHVAFLVLWLSYFVFPSNSYHIDKAIFPIAVHLSSGTKIALAPAVLAHLYAELSLLKNHIRASNESPIRAKLELTALFKLVQVWVWERFRDLKPKPNPMLKGEPRMSRWSDLKQRTSGARQMLESSKVDSFEWRPYTKTVKNWDFPKFYPEKAMWIPFGPNLDDDFISFARCLKVSELVGIENVEHYFPNRVNSQFGMFHVPCFLNRNNLSQEAAWNEYNKSLDGVTIFIPSRLDRVHVTATYQDDHYDEEIDVSPKVLPLSEVVQKLENRFLAKGRRSKMRRSVNKDKIGELANSLVSSGWKMNKSVHKKTALEDSDAEKSGGDGSETLVKRIRRYVAADTDDSGSEENDETASKALKTRRVCDDFEVDVNGNTAEKRTMMDDEIGNGSIMQITGTKKAECLVHEDGEKKQFNERWNSAVKKKEEIDERLKQRKLKIKEMELNLEARLIEMEKTLAKIRKLKTTRNQTKGGVSA